MRRSERAVTPAMGVVLMVGITISLLVLVAPLIFTVSNSAGESDAPNPQFSFFYEEDTADDTEDTFGETGDTADGLITIRVEDEDGMQAGNIRIEGAASGTALVEDTSSDEYEAGDSILSGDEITLWANQGDTIKIIWTSENGEESAILEEYSLPNVDNLPAYAPEPDVGCEWVEEQLDGSSDLVVDGIVVECDLDQFNIDNVDIKNEGAVIGNVQANSDITLDDGSTFNGFVEAETGKVDMMKSSEINGNVEAQSGLDLDDSSVINGNVDSNNDINLWKSSEINGDVTVSGDDALIDSSSVDGNVIANNDTNVNLVDAYVIGKIDATANVGLDEESTVTGDVLLDDSGDNLECNDGDDSTINGEGCKEYRAATFTVTVDSTNSPVEEENTVEVTATIENVGYESGTQTVTLDIDGYQNDSKSISLNDGQKTTKTFEWSTNSGDSGTYTAKVSSENDTSSKDVEVAGDVPPKFETLNLTLTKVTGAGDVNKVEFEYTLSESGTITFELVKDGTIEDTTARTSSGETWEWNHAKTSLAVFFRADINTGGCYEIRVPGGASEGTTYDLLNEGSTC